MAKAIRRTAASAGPLAVAGRRNFTGCSVPGTAASALSAAACVLIFYNGGMLCAEPGLRTTTRLASFMAVQVRYRVLTAPLITRERREVSTDSFPGGQSLLQV